MKIKEGYTLKTVANQHLVIPIGKEGVNFNGIITLNDSGKMLFEAMRKDITRDNLINMVMDRYDIDKTTAENDIDDFIEILKNKNLLA